MPGSSSARQASSSGRDPAGSSPTLRPTSSEHFTPNRWRYVMLKLYSADLSPYSSRVRMQIYAKGLSDIAIELPDDWGMPKFRERFPLGRVPVLEVDGDMIPESGV